MQKLIIYFFYFLKMQKSYIYVVFYYNDYYKNYIHQNIKCFDNKETAINYANKFIDNKDNSKPEYGHYDDTIYDFVIRSNLNNSNDDTENNEDLISHINSLVFMDYPRIAIFEIEKA